MVSDSRNIEQLSDAAALNDSMPSMGEITNDTAQGRGKSYPYVHSMQSVTSSGVGDQSLGATAPLADTPLSDTQSAGRLPAVLGTRDLTVLMLLIVLFIANTTGVQFGGPAAFCYWALGLFTFLIPCAYVTQWLARCFPGQGAPYLWAMRILGPRWSFFSAFAAWMSGALAVVSAIESGFIFIQYLAPRWFTRPAEQGVAIVVILLVPTLIACLPLRVLKHILLVVAALYFGVFVLLGIAGGWWLLSGHQAAIALSIPASWRPTSGNFAVYGVVILALLGVDIPIFMGGEIRGGKAGAKRATSYVWWGTALSIIAYIMGTFGVMVIVPSGQSGAMAANVQAISTVFGSFAGDVTAIVLALSQVALTIAYILVFSRLLVVVARDHRLPTLFAKTNRHGVPIVSIVVQAAVVALVAILALVVVPNFIGTLIHPDSDILALAIYNVLQAGTTVVWVCTIIQIFVLVLWFLYRRNARANTSRRQRLLLLCMTLVGIAASLVGIWATISSSWLPADIPDGRWAILVLGVTFISLFIGGISSELPRLNALLSEQRRMNDREVALRGRLQEAYNEQEILVQQQQELLAEVDRLYREQARAAVTDAITGLPNHRAIMSRIDEELAHCRRSDRSCAILFVDVDHFKRVNDTCGHRAGDAILHEIGARLRSTLRLEDFVGRYGGEEFAVVLTDTDLNGAGMTAERLREIIAERPCFWEAEDCQSVVPISINASIGVAVYQLHSVTREALIESADRAMYRAKQSGRNCVRVAEVEVAGESEPFKKKQPALDTKQIVHTTEVGTVRALSTAASAHDRGSDAHAHRLVWLAEATARELRRPEEELHLIRLAALLHDIGKIGIPDAILHKPGPLSDEEWTIMRQHPQISCEILEQAGGIFHLLAHIVVAHHERWDGSGYPAGLSEEVIPISARIISVVDSYDAMTSSRVYRQALTSEQAKEELRHGAGSQFDPQVVAAFLHILEAQEQGMLPSEESTNTTNAAAGEKEQVPAV